MKKIVYHLLMVAGIAALCMGCGSSVNEKAEEVQVSEKQIQEEHVQQEQLKRESQATADTGNETDAEMTGPETAETEVAEPAEPEIAETGMTEIETEEKQMVQNDTQPEAEITQKETSAAKGKLIAIDAGHQSKGNSEKEPVGPGAAQTKAKVTGGTSGVASGLKEYELTLAVSMKLRDELTARGYEVLMIRETNDVNISNAERAQIANEAGADVFVRIHANGSEDASVKGVMTICQTADNPYNAAIYEDSKGLSEKVLDGIVAATGAKKQRVWETDTMSGINWASVPVTIVEMGYMTNAKEDARMAEEDYQSLIAAGIADGIDGYMN